jgi:hypothetical protein
VALHWHDAPVADGCACLWLKAHLSPWKGPRASERLGWRQRFRLARSELAAPQRIDLLTEQRHLPLPDQLAASTYTSFAVLAPNTAAAPLANAVTPIGGSATALTTPSGQQSGLKANVNLTVPAGQVADFAIDFDACKSFVKAGNSGRVLLKPVLAVIPILSTAGQRIVGFVAPALANAGTAVSAQSAGHPVRATSPDAKGRFVLYPVDVGNYDLVIAGRPPTRDDRRPSAAPRRPSW